ncbi:VOC family protein [Sandaracinobacteroides hominis]|uniref:VOC family protein n=1 Tax=Sandaracinobacteroides hominis TaxID=2780086 RepID=UPI0018F5C5FE|nr:VOC family protein [Sandaracinobacteroides hominis]
MTKITGIGGVFYKVADVEKTNAWYRDVLGIGGEFGATFPFANDSDEGFSIYSPFKAESDYFAPSEAPFMVNFRVDNLDGFVEELERKGVTVLGRQEEPYGKFAWILDCDGIKIELWEQLGPAP